MERQRVVVDPAVAAVLGDAEKRATRRTMTQRQRKQAVRDEKRKRVTWELEPRIVEMVERIARAEGVSPASATNLLVVEAVARYVDGALVFDGQRRPSRSPRYEFVIELDERIGDVQMRLEEFLKLGKE